MSNAPNYTPNVSFATEETNSVAGRSTVRTVALDTELANISSAHNALNTNVKKIQRDDGRLRDLSIEPFMLSEQTKSLLAARGIIRGLWQPNTEYKRGEIVQYLSSGFVSLYDHKSSGAFNYSLWLALSGDGTATQKAIEAAASAASALASANSADVSEAAAMVAQTAAESAQAISEANADVATNAANVADAAKTTALNAANSAQLNANAAAASAIDADASADLAYQYSLLASPIQYAVTTGTLSAYEADLTVPIVGYADEQTFKFRFHTTCATNATLKISGVNPPLDLKIQDAYGDYINVFEGDIIAGHYAICTVILGGTALLVESAIDVNNRVGMTYDTYGYEPDPNTMEVPLVATNLNRLTYRRLYKKLVKTSIVTLTIANPGVVNWVGHGLKNGAPVYLTTTGALPTGHTSNAKRYVVNQSTDAFQLSLTKGGAAIITTGSQSGIHTASYAPHGNGDGVTTFGCPFLAQDNVEVRGVEGNLGETTVGAVISHNHLQDPHRHSMTEDTDNVGDGIYIVDSAGGAPDATVAVTEYTTATNQATGGAANLPAGIRTMKLLVYR